MKVKDISFNYRSQTCYICASDKTLAFFMEMEKRIEEEVFYRYQPNIRKLKAYGFSICDQGYIYEQMIMDDTFQVQVIITKNDKVIVKIYDAELNEEYTNILLGNE